MDSVKFHFDPRCPWCYQTSQWVRRLDELGTIEADWGVFSLEIVNSPEGTDPETIEAVSGPALRTAILIRDSEGSKAIGPFYKALGKRIWESYPAMNDMVEITREALVEIGLDPGLLDKALADPATWTAVIEEHRGPDRDEQELRRPDDRPRRRSRPRDLRTGHLRDARRRDVGRDVGARRVAHPVPELRRAQAGPTGATGSPRLAVADRAAGEGAGAGDLTFRGRGGYFPPPLKTLARTLIVSPTMTTPKSQETSAWRSAVLRIALEVRSVSETWNVIPIVSAR